MNIGQLEHIIRAAAVITEDDELIIIGSQSILGAHPNAPENLLVSAEVDVYPKNHPERADLIDGTIGESAPDAAVLPDRWEVRLIPIKTPATRGATAGVCTRSTWRWRSSPRGARRTCGSSPRWFERRCFPGRSSSAWPPRCAPHPTS